MAAEEEEYSEIYCWGSKRRLTPGNSYGQLGMENKDYGTLL